MKREYHRWYSSRIGWEMGVVAYGHYGQPLIGFPTGGGAEWGLENQGMMGALGDVMVAFIWDNLQSPGILDSTIGVLIGAYHAANSLFKHPDVIKRCFAMSGVYDVRNFMDGMYDNNFYFNNPVDYLANLNDPWVLGQLASCDIHISTGTGQWENSGPTYRLSEILSSKGIRHSLDNWGPEGGHDWPYWKHQMREYVARLF